MSFGPVSSAANSSHRLLDDPVGLVFVTGILGLLVVQWTRFFKRNRDLRSMVERRSWQWISEALPYSLPERDLLSLDQNRDLTISNAFAGTIREIEFVCCDCRIGTGRRTTSLTLIAARSGENPFSVNRWDSSYRSTEAGGWVALLPESGRTLPVSLIEAIIENIRPNAS